MNAAVRMFAGLLIAAAPAVAYELPDELRERVDALIASVEQSPSTVDTVGERAAVLFDWANAASLEGAFIPKNVSLAVNGTMNPTPGTDPPGFFIDLIDLYVRQLATLAEDPNAWIGGDRAGDPSPSGQRSDDRGRVDGRFQGHRPRWRHHHQSSRDGRLQPPPDHRTVRSRMGEHLQQS